MQIWKIVDRVVASGKQLGSRDVDSRCYQTSLYSIFVLVFLYIYQSGYLREYISALIKNSACIAGAPRADETGLNADAWGLLSHRLRDEPTRSLSCFSAGLINCELESGTDPRAESAVGGTSIIHAE